MDRPVVPLRPASRIAFVIAELRAKNPVLDVRYFRRSTFAGSNIIAFTTYFGTFAIFFMVALYLQVVGSKSPLGLALQFHSTGCRHGDRLVAHRTLGGRRGARASPWPRAAF